METVVVALVVGAFSGLFGSIAGPWLTHRLSRERRKEERQEERNQELRRMLTVLMRLARIAHSTSVVIQLVEARGGNIGQELETHDRYVTGLEAMHPEYAWRPQRIHDVTLRRLAIAFNLAQSELHVLIGARRGVGYQIGILATWPEQVRNVRRWVDLLMDAVDRRMDELGW